MNAPTVLLANFPAVARVAPFVVFVVLTSLESWFGETGRYWLYLAKTLIGAWMLWSVRSVVREMRWNGSWQAVAAGVAVFAVWVGLDGIIPTLQELWIKLGLQELWIKLGLSKAPPTPTPAWNPFAKFGNGAVMGWFFVYVHLLGSAIVVPPLEEIFYRSFLYRWIARPDFASVPLGEFAWKPFIIATVLFGFAHNEWLAGMLCAATYQGLVCWNKRLGDAMTAHAVTNFLLGIWVVWRGAWHFW